MRACALVIGLLAGCGHLLVEPTPDARADTAGPVDGALADGRLGDPSTDAIPDLGPDLFVADDADITPMPDAGPLPDVPADVPQDTPDAGPSPLVNRGLLVRYSMALGGDGELRSSAMPFDLPRVGLAGTITPVDTATGAALSFSQAGIEDGYCAVIAGSPVELLNDSAWGTIEVVVSVTDADVNGSRFLATGQDGRWGFSLGQNASGSILFSMSQSDIDFGRWPAPPLGDRHVLTVTYNALTDTDQALLTLFIDGVPQVNEGPGLPVGSRLFLPPTNFTCVGNSSTRDRSPAGVVYYAAYYQEVLSETEVMTNAAMLLANDDL